MNIFFDKVECSHLILSDWGGGDFENSISKFITCDMTIDSLGNEYNLKEVKLIEFYMDFLECLSDAVVRGSESSIREDFQDILMLIPADNGCLVTEIRPPYPVAEFNAAHEVLSLHQIREIARTIEEIIRGILSTYRDKILLEFEKNQSIYLFRILKIIDKSNIIKP